MKTFFKEWFESVENPILGKVLLMRLVKKNNADIRTKCLFEDVECGFNWEETYENHSFWKKVVDELKTSNESKTFNAKYPVMQVEWLDDNECIHCETCEEAVKLSKLLDIKLDKQSKFDLLLNTLNISTNVYYFPKQHKIEFGINLEDYVVYPAKLFIKQENKMENLLEEAKRRYPVGCKFDFGNKVGEILYDDFHYDDFTNDKDGIFVTCKTSQYVKSILAVYKWNQWAKYVEVFGFKVGDILDKDILNEWEHEWKHEQLSPVQWKLQTNKWGWSPSIREIEYIDNCICLRLNNNVLIKAEGLREFINSKQNQMKTLTELPKYFVIKRDENNPLWSKYIDWINQTYKPTGKWKGFELYYGNTKKYGVCGWVEYLRDVFEDSDTHFITLEQWDSIVNKPKFEIGKYFINGFYEL